MSDDIRPGDCVVCVDARPSKNPAAPALIKGRYYRVEKVRSGPLTGAVIIGLSEMPLGDGRHWCFYADRFRKIDAPNTKIARRIRACRPIKVGEDA